MTLLTTTSVGRNRNSSEGSLRSPSLQVLYLLHILFDESSLLFGRIVKPFKKALGRFLLSNKYKRRKAIGLGPLQKEGAEMMQAPFSLLTFQLLIKAQHRIVYLATIKKTRRNSERHWKLIKNHSGFEPTSSDSRCYHHDRRLNQLRHKVLLFEACALVSGRTLLGVAIGWPSLLSRPLCPCTVLLGVSPCGTTISIIS